MLRLFKFILIVSLLLAFSYPLWLPALLNVVISSRLDREGVSFKVKFLSHNSMHIENFEMENEEMTLKADLVFLKFDVWQLIEKPVFEELKIYQLDLELKETGDSDNKATDIELPVEIKKFSINNTKISHSFGEVRVNDLEGELRAEHILSEFTLPFLNHSSKMKLKIFLKPELHFDLATALFLQDSQKSPELKLKGDLNHIDIQWEGMSEAMSLHWEKEIGLSFNHMNGVSSKLRGQEFSGNTTLVLNKAKVGDLYWNLNLDQEKSGDSEILLSLPEMSSEHYRMKGLDLKLRREAGVIWRIKGSCQEYQNPQGRLSDLKFEIPLSFSDQLGYISGNFHQEKIDEVNFRIEIERGSGKWSMRGDLDIDKLGLNELPFKAGLNLRSIWTQPLFWLSSNIQDREVSVFTDEFNLPSGHFSASVNAQIYFDFSLNHGLKEHVEIAWSKGFFANDDFSVSIGGLEGVINSDSLMNKMTGPSQKLAWKSFKGNGMEVTNGELYWQWEKQQKLFIESLKMDWCGGSLSLLPMRLESDSSDFSLTFFCERVQLSEILQTFQVGEVEGSGELGGKISLAYQKGKWEFEDTYLYSDPASEGRLLIKEAQLLDQAMGQSRLQMVRESLKDYQYKWAKLNFVSEEGDLLIKLVMDGKPNGLLPFRFDPKTAEFVYDKDAPGVNLQGLKLNNNFRSEQFMPILEKALNLIKKVELQ